MFWSSVPFVRLVVPLLLGACLGREWIDEGFPLFGTLTLSFLVLSLIFFFYKRIGDYRIRWIYGSIAYISLFLYACNWFLIIPEKQFRDHLVYVQDSVYCYRALVVEQAEEKEKSYKVLLALDAIKTSLGWNGCRGKVLAYIEKDSMAECLTNGNVLIFNAAISEIQPPSNPEEFNYKAFLNRKHIYHQLYLRKNHWLILDSKNGSIKTCISGLRQKLIGDLRKHSDDPQKISLLSAILLGYKTLLDDQTQQQFSRAGAMHVLCVSGLHVGIIYLLLQRILKRIRCKKMLKCLILLAAVWFFALLTGLSPSIQRAAFMISIIIIGENIGRKVNVYNSVFSSAFVLFIVNPLILYEVGFQLSYLAVLGIVSIQPLVNAIFYTRSKILSNIWSIMSVSIAAQLGTFPLAILYFHSFPVWFLLANLVIIPLASYLIYCGFLLFLFSGISFLQALVGKFLLTGVTFLLWTIAIINQLPFQAENIYINQMMMGTLYAAIIGFFLLLKYRKKVFIYLMILFIWGFFFQHSFMIEERNQRVEFIIYDTDRHLVIDMISGMDHYLLMDSAITVNPNALAYSVQNYWTKCGLNKPGRIIMEWGAFQDGESVLYRKPFIQYKEYKALLVDKTYEPACLKKPVKLDIIILTYCSLADLERILKDFHFSGMVLTSCLPYWQRDKIIKHLKRKDISFWDIREEGFFRKNLN